jgi:hypothetical protein
VGEETFNLREHAAADLLRLGFVHDVVRLEGFAHGLPGVAVLLSNEPGLWKDSPRVTRDRDFRLHEGRQLQGSLLWAGGSYQPNTQELRGAYSLGWKDYSTLDARLGGQLRYLGVEVPHVRTAGSHSSGVPL